VVLVEGGRVTRRVVGPSTAEGYSKHLLEAPRAPVESAKDAKARHRVTVFTTPSCSWCTRVKKYLDGHGVSYSETDVAKNERARDQMIARSGQMGVPQLDIDGRMVVGFDKPRIDQLLGLSAAAP
jgi:glutaredoxin-like YruB-family protein